MGLVRLVPQGDRCVRGRHLHGRPRGGIIPDPPHLTEKALAVIRHRRRHPRAGGAPAAHGVGARGVGGASLSVYPSGFEAHATWGGDVATMGPARRFLAGITFLLVPLSAPAADLAPPVPVCFERLPDGTVSAKAPGGGRFQVIPAGGLDNQAGWFQHSVIRRGDTIKAAGAQIQQYVEVEEITPEAVVLKNRGWARGIGEVDNTTRTGFGW